MPNKKASEIMEVEVCPSSLRSSEKILMVGVLNNNKKKKMINYFSGKMILNGFWM